MTYNLAMLARVCAIEEVSTIKLYSALVGQDLHLSARNRLVESCNTTHTLAIYAPVVVVTSATADLLIVRLNIFANSLRHAEVEWSTLHRAQLARRDELRRDWHKLLGNNLQLVTENALRC